MKIVKIVRTARVCAVNPYLVKIVNMVKREWASGLCVVYANLMKTVKIMKMGEAGGKNVVALEIPVYVA